MTLFNPNWITQDGEPLGGLVPTQVTVSGASQTVPPGVANVYQAFATAVNNSPFPGGYHSRSLILANGSKVYMESLNGVQRVWVRAPEGETLLASTGIGICVADGTDTLITGFTVEVPPPEGGAPVTKSQPLLLQPVVKNQNGVAVPTGEWRVKRVPKLMGGQLLWVSKSRRDWYSVFSRRGFQDPAGFVYSVANGEDSYARFIDTTWTPANNTAVPTNPRVSVTTPPPAFLPVGGNSRYIMRGGKTVRMSAELSNPTPVFIHNNLTHGKLQYSLDIYQGSITAWVNKLRDVEGLDVTSYTPALGDALGDEESESTGEFENTFEMTFAGPYRLAGSTLAIHPDGDRAVMLAYEFGIPNPRNDFVATVQLDGTTGELTISHAGVASRTLSQSGVRNFTGDPAAGGGGDYTFSKGSGRTSLNRILWNDAGTAEYELVVENETLTSQETFSQSLIPDTFLTEVTAWNRTASMSNSKTLQFGATSELVASSSFSGTVTLATYAGSYLSMSKDILFFDRKLDLMVFRRTTIGASFAVPPGDAYPYGPSFGIINPAYLTASRGFEVVIRLKGVETVVFQEATSAASATTGIPDPHFADPKVQSTLFAGPAGTETLAGGAPERGLSDFFPFSVSFTPAVSAVVLNYARDPRTGSIILCIDRTRPDTTKVSYSYGVTPVNIKPLEDIIKVERPVSGVTFWKKNRFNNLVSV